MIRVVHPGSRIQRIPDPQHCLEVGLVGGEVLAVAAAESAQPLLHPRGDSQEYRLGDQVHQACEHALLEKEKKVSKRFRSYVSIYSQLC
jgi:hypothetical protein